MLKVSGLVLNVGLFEIVKIMEICGRFGFQDNNEIIISVKLNVR